MTTSLTAMRLIVLSVLIIVPVKGLEQPRLVYPRLLEERSSDGRMLVHVHDDLTLNLRKASVAAPQLRVLMEEGGRPVTRFYSGDHIERDLYEDEKEIATVTVTRSRNGVRLEGLVGPNHRIEPLPVSEKSAEGVVAHAIHEIEQKEMLDKAITYTNKARDAAISEEELKARSLMPEVVVIEVFVVLDIAHHSHFSSTKHVLWYLCVIINSANLRFHATSKPRVQLMLTGAERSEQKQQEQYAFIPKPGFLFDDISIPLFKQYASNRKADYGNPDLVYLMTGLDVMTFHKGKVTDAGLGIAYVSSLCTRSAVGLGEDKPRLFSGMHTFTHEVAHILGAYHDGEGPEDHTDKHPGAKSCSWDLGHIMSYINKGPSHHQFSSCSLAQIRYVVSRAGESCWEVSSSGHFVKRVYPGMALSFKDFCSDLPYDKENSTFDYATVKIATCKVECHFYKLVISEVFLDMDPVRVPYLYRGDAVDFMPCGSREVCIQGVCVETPSQTRVKNHPTNDEPTKEEPTATTEVGSSDYADVTEARTTVRTTTRKFAYRHRPRRA